MNDCVAHSRIFVSLALAALLLLIAVPPPAPGGEREIEWTASPGIERIFSAAGVTGTFVSCRTVDGVVTGFNPERATRRLPPASTFKIPHTLVALDAGVVEGIDEVFAWDGSPRRFAGWERDMTFKEAMLRSNLHVYQEIARRIGRERMATQVRALDYGNREIGTGLETFWLEGPLAISAVEQCRFLLRLATGRLPYSAQTVNILREMIAEPAGPDIKLYAKTGWADATDPDLGWWVGWIEGPFGIAAFALNIDMPDAGFVPRRIELGREALTHLGFLPPD